MDNHWYNLSIEDALKESGSSTEGLDDAAVKERQEKYGRNILEQKKKTHPLFIFLRQFLDIMILVLGIAAVISTIIGEVSDTIVIVVIIVLNAIIGFIQEYRAEKAMEALQKMSAPHTIVIRNGKEEKIESDGLVPGDIVVLEAGNTVPADLRLIELETLRISEASLTGESNPVDKKTDALKDKNLQPGDKINMAFKGTAVTSGRGKGVVSGTGMNTELGKIAGMLDKAESTTPLQKRLTDFSRKLTFIVIGLCAALFLVGYIRGEELNRMLLTSISLAVAAIPEALPAVVTISLALGARRLMKQEALIRKLYAVETLGSVTYICTDKTGTLTMNKMSVQKIWTSDKKNEEELLLAMSLNHDVKEKDGKLTGDPTEIAMVEHAKKKGMLKRVKEIPFDSERKAMTTIHERNGKYWIITKGAAESVFGMIKDRKTGEEIKKQEEEFAKEGMRVIGFAGRMADKLPDQIDAEAIEKDLEFIGLAGLIDPPREEAKDAIHQCKTAGIVTVMITGDHPLTAASIAKQIGIIDNEEQKVMTGKEMAEMDDEKFEKIRDEIRVYARVSPKQKLQIVETLQE